MRAAPFRFCRGVRAGVAVEPTCYLPDMAVVRALASAENSIERWWQKLAAAQKHPEGSFKVVNALAMAASYDPDPTQFLISTGLPKRPVLGHDPTTAPTALDGSFGVDTAITHALRHSDFWAAAACHSGDMGFELWSGGGNRKCSSHHGQN